MDLESLLAEAAVGHPHPLGPGRILRELESLERDMGFEVGVRFRLSTLNLVVVCPTPATARGLGALLVELSSDFPCRCLVALLDPAAPEGDMQAWASLTCHPQRGQHMCCEQVLLYCPGSQGDSIPSLVSATLRPDVPTFSWWRGHPPFGSHLLEQLTGLSNRVVLDSHFLPTPRLAAILDLVADRYHQMQAFSDLSWGQLEGWREEIASLFDPPEATPALQALDRVEITYVPDAEWLPPRPLLLAGWLAARLGWKAAPLRWRDGALVAGLQASSGPVQLRLVPSPGPTGAPCGFRATGAGGREFRLQAARPWRPAGAPGPRPGLPAERIQELEGIGRELATLSRDVVYQEALQAATELLPPGSWPKVEVVPPGQDLAEVACSVIEQVLAEGSVPCRAALAGGSSPRRVYSLLAGRDLPWERLRLFLGDERAVPCDHEDSNYRMVSETLLAEARLGPEQVRRWATELEPPAAAEAYARVLEEEFGGWPCFDLVLLGMGEDGHTASLFPGSPALEVTDRPAAANPVGGRQGWRLTLTLPALKAARRVLFLVGGQAKAPALRRVLAGEDLPAARVHGLEETRWLVDAAAWSGSSAGALA